MPKELEKFDFSPDQKREIEEGIEAGLDISMYARPEFLAMQMRQIKMGLMEGLDVKIYADPAYDWFQMEQLRKGLSYDIDVRPYASPDISYDKMRQVRKGLRYGIDASPYVKYSSDILKQIRHAMRYDIDLIPYVEKGCDGDELEQVRLAHMSGVDLDPYLETGFRGVALEQIREGLRSGVDVSVFAKVEYSWAQMKEIRLGLEKQLKVSAYANPLYSHRQMEEIRLGLESGLPVETYNSLRFSATDMEEKRLRLLEETKAQGGAAQSGGRAMGAVLMRTSDSASNQEEEDKVAAFELMFTPDDMEVFLMLRDADAVVTEDEILSALWASKVRKGIQRKEITAIASGANKSRNVLVACGQPPKQGADGHYEFFFRTDIDRTPKVLEDGSVDYQNVEWFDTVREGEKLAFYHPAEKGTDGYTVRGDVLPARSGKEIGVLIGYGFNMLDDRRTYIATTDGWVNQYKNHLEVNSKLEVEEVTMATGNIVFNGSVHVKGNVGSQTEIHAQGDILVDGFVESAILESGGNVVLRQGMNAAGAGSVKAAGNVSGRFFEATDIQAGGKIEANYCMNCELESEDCIEISGNLVGGRAYAVKGITVQNLGNRAAVSTYVKVGINDAILEEFKGLSDEVNAISEELVLLQNARTEFEKKYPPEIRNEMEVYSKIKDAIFTKEEQYQEKTDRKDEIEAEMKKISTACTLVKGRVYEGVLAEVNGKRWISRFMMNITIRKTADDKIAVYKN